MEYTDDTFTTREPQPNWLGILGPVIRAEVGDEIVVDFLNRGHRGHDIHPHPPHTACATLNLSALKGKVLRRSQDENNEGLSVFTRRQRSLRSSWQQL